MRDICKSQSENPLISGTGTATAWYLWLESRIEVEPTTEDDESGVLAAKVWVGSFTLNEIRTSAQK